MAPQHKTVMPHAKLHNPEHLTPEQSASNLFPLQGMQRRGRSEDSVHHQRLAYLAGVTARMDAMAHVFMDEAERARYPTPNIASSYDRRERQAFEWGWEDAALGRLTLPEEWR